MKRLLVVAVLVLAASGFYRFYGSPQTGTGSLTLPQPAPNVDESAPPLSVGREDGGPFELPREGVCVLAFWSTLNKDTAETRPVFAEMAQDYEDASFAAVYVSYAPELEEDPPYAVLQDPSGELTARYNVKTVPRLFLIDDGIIELVQDGFYSQSEEQLREELDRALQEEDET